MVTINLRLGWAELLALVAVALVPAFLTPAFLGGWTIALVPGLTYLLAVGVTYGIYRQHVSEKARAWLPAVPALAFRVVETRGVCPLGRGKGDLVTVDVAGSVSPRLCAHAEAVLRRAVVAGEEQQVKQWCCPIFDHMLVFEAEAKAA